MRRKSERVKSSPSVKQPESVTRRTTRRNKKSPEKSITEEESDITSDQASHSDSDSEEVQVPTKRGKRGARATAEKEKVTRSRRKTVNKKTQDEPEGGDEVPAVTNESDTQNEDAAAPKSGVDDESIATTADSEPAIEQDGGRKDNGSIDADQDAAKREQTSPARESANDNDAIEISFAANETLMELDSGEQEASKSNAEEKPAATHAEVDQPNEANTGRDCEVIPEKEIERVAHVTTTSESLTQDSAVATVAVIDSTVSTKKTKEISEKSDIDTTVDRDGVTAADEADCRDGTNDEPKDARVENASGQIHSKSKNSPRSKSNALNANKENEAATKKPIVRKRKWLSSKSATPKVQEIAISTDSLKGLISDVKPVPLADVDLDSSPDPDHESDDVKVVSSTSIDYNRRSEERTYHESPPRIVADETPSAKSTLNTARKVSIIPDIDEPRPPSPAKHNPCNILFITNLVRPFTILQLKGLLQRTGKIVENGFWMDKIKSKCFVKYETEDEAVETRHALHGIQWPASNPKCLNVDFGTEQLMDKAIALTAADAKPVISSRDDRIGSSGDLYDHDRERPVTTEKPVREWDVGKKHDTLRSRDQERSEKDRERARSREGNRESERDRDRNDRRRRVSPEKRRASTSPSPSRKYSKKENEPPLRLLDDLFRKTKTTPCIYWLPLTPEQISVREEERLKQMAEHKRRLEQIKKDRVERQQNRDVAGANNGERDRERDRRDRDRDRDRRDSRRRRDSSRSSRDRDRGGRRRY